MNKREIFEVGKGILLWIAIITICVSGMSKCVDSLNKQTKEEANKTLHDTETFNKEQINKPTVVGVLPNGKTLFRVMQRIPDCDGCTGFQTHYIYYTNSDNSVSVNYPIRQGKTIHIASQYSEIH